jgi:hypothetical protein
LITKEEKFPPFLSRAVSKSINICLEPLPQPLSYEERGVFFLITKYLKLLITPPSLAGKGVGGLGHKISGRE